MSRYAVPLLLATLVCALATLAASALLRVFDLSNVVMLFLMTVVLIALRLGRLAGAWAAFVCVGCFDFFFVEPRLSFAVSDTQYVFTFALMLAVALAIGQLAARARSAPRARTRSARRRWPGSRMICRRRSRPSRSHRSAPARSRRCWACASRSYCRMRMIT